MKCWRSLAVGNNPTKSAQLLLELGFALRSTPSNEIKPNKISSTFAGVGFRPSLNTNLRKHHVFPD
jgi:hypothetical protein